MLISEVKVSQVKGGVDEAVRGHRIPGAGLLHLQEQAHDEASGVETTRCK